MGIFLMFTSFQPKPIRGESIKFLCSTYCCGKEGGHGCVLNRDPPKKNNNSGLSLVSLQTQPQKGTLKKTTPHVKQVPWVFYQQNGWPPDLIKHRADGGPCFFQSGVLTPHFAGGSFSSGAARRARRGRCWRGCNWPQALARSRL